MRFPEFKGEWTKFTASSFLKTFSTNSLTWDQLNYSSGQIKDIHYGLIHSQFTQTLVDLRKVKIPFVNHGIQIKNYTSIKLGDLILADASEDTNEIGQPIEFTNIPKDGTIILGLHTIHCRDIKNLTVKGFKAFLFKSKSVKHRLYSLAEGTKIYSISPSTLNEIDLFIPKAEEQTKIASLLSTLEKKIDIQRKTIEDLETLRDSTEENAINKFVQSWIPLKQAVIMGKIKLKRGNIIPKHSKDESFIYPVYSSSSQKNGLMGWSNKYRFNEELITWSIDGGGKFFYRSKHKFNVTNVCGILEADTTEFDYRFLVSALLQQWRRNRFDYQSKAHPSVIETIYKIPIVSKEKQVICSKLFKDIDNLIEKERDKLNEDIKLKKYLLSSLFI